MRKKDIPGLLAVAASLSALIALGVDGLGANPVPTALLALSCSIAIADLAFRGGTARRDGDKKKDGQDNGAQGRRYREEAGISDPVMSIVRSIQDDQADSLGRSACAEKYPGLRKIIESRDIGEVYANIESAYRSYERNGRIAKDLLDRLVTDCLVFLPLAKSVLKAVPEKTEEAAFAVMEKFMVVREASSGAAAKAKGLREELADTEGRDSIHFTAERTRQAVRKEREVVKGLSRTIRENREHLEAMGHEIESGIDLLRNIEDITERSKLIAFNMSIEAARIGEGGKGFKVIIAELHRLNEMTFDFSRRVADLLGKFREYNALLAENIERKAGAVIVEAERGMDAAESSIESLIGASERTQRFTQDIAAISESIDHDLDGVLESLQFQDITRQMIEGAQTILSMLGQTLDECLSIEGVAVDGDNKKRRFAAMKDRLVKAAKTKGEKAALLEVEV